MTDKITIYSSHPQPGPHQADQEQTGAHPNKNQQRFSSSRWKIVAWMMLTTSIAVAGLIWTVREVQINQVSNQASDATVHEIGEFRQFAEIGVDPETSEPFSSAEDMLRTYIARQYSGYTEQLIGITPQSILYLKSTKDFGLENGYKPHQDSQLLETITSSEQVSGIAQTPAGPISWGKVNIRVEGNDHPTGQLIVLEFMQPGINQVQNTVTTMIGVGALALLATIVISWFIAGQISKPVRNLRRVAAKITERTMDGRVPVTGNDDVTAMSITFNQMLDRVEEFSTVQKEFLDDVSHELRTPITIVRGHLELMDRTTPDQESTLALVDDELERMGRIVGDLLLLAKTERPDFINPTPTDVADLIIALDSKVQAFSKHRWNIDEIAEGEVLMDSQRITQAMVQYCANAAQYSPEGSLISLGTSYGVHQGQRYLELWVRDRGPGVPLEDAPHLFERFKRSHDKNPATAQRHSIGAGLGLAIVRAIAESHQGFVWLAAPADGQGSIFGLSIPAPHNERTHP